MLGKFKEMRSENKIATHNEQTRLSEWFPFTICILTVYTSLFYF